MLELVTLLKKYEEKTKKRCVSYRIFSDGSGSLIYNNEDIFDFEKLNSLIEHLLEVICNGETIE
tara:strand:- start:1622 stop:1813 length:192 start_codon:yes stop_codon:yes gene_type:complete